MKKSYRIIAISLIIISIFTLVSCSSKSDGKFEYWNDCKAINQLVDYVKDVTNVKSANYIPVEDRIAVFDMDGTLYGELFPVYLEYLLLVHRCLDDPTYVADESDKQVAMNIREKGVSGTTPMEHAISQAKVFKGFTPEEFDAYVKDFLKTNCEGFQNMKYGEAFYKPMLEVFAYLQNNGFKTYVVSGSDRFICRSLVCEVLNIPESQVIGMDVQLESSNQNGVNGLDYQYTPSDKVVRGETVLVKNLKMNKVSQIVQEIGKQPVLSFGNSSGDTSMHNFTISNNKYKSAAFMLIANDESRDYGNAEKANKLGDEWNEKGFTVISMKDDFKTIYGYDVVKTK